MKRLVAKQGLCAALVLSCLFSPGCEDHVLPDVNLERMIHQERYQPYEASEYFADGKVMRRPPTGTVARDHVIADPAITSGIAGGAYVTRVPLPLSREALEVGRARFETFCAACHGMTGDGNSVVARNMTLRKPPSLVSPTVRAFPPGRVFQVISEGYGLMRPYRDELPIEERWAVVAYLSALQKSRGVPLDALPPEDRARAEKELP